MTGLNGWPESALVFYEGLEADNSKAYWLGHKDVYERDVKGPMEALLAELAANFGEPRPFRPNHDTQFSRDKSPYKTAIAARIGHGYVQFLADGLLAGVGTYHMAPDQLERYRGRGGRRPDGPQASGRRRPRCGGRGSRSPRWRRSRAPPGLSQGLPRIELLTSQGLVAMKSWPAAGWLSTAAAKKRVVDLLAHGAAAGLARRARRSQRRTSAPRGEAGHRQGPVGVPVDEHLGAAPVVRPGGGQAGEVDEGYEVVGRGDGEGVVGMLGQLATSPGESTTTSRAASLKRSAQSKAASGFPQSRRPRLSTTFPLATINTPTAQRRQSGPQLEVVVERLQRVDGELQTGTSASG